MALAPGIQASKGPQNLCSTCAQYDWEYHIHRYGDNRFVEDRKAWNDDAEQRLRIPRTDNKGGRYFMAATDTRFFLRTFLDAKTNSTRCDLCRVIVLRAQRNEQLNALITDSSEELLCVVQSITHNSSPIHIGVANTNLTLKDRAWLLFTISGDYSSLPRRHVVDELCIRPGLLRYWLDKCVGSYEACKQYSMHNKKKPPSNSAPSRSSMFTRGR
jgi:hypothetical protein